MYSMVYYCLQTALILQPTYACVLCAPARGTRGERAPAGLVLHGRRILMYRVYHTNITPQNTASVTIVTLRYISNLVEDKDRILHIHPIGLQLSYSVYNDIVLYDTPTNTYSPCTTAVHLYEVLEKALLYYRCSQKHSSVYSQRVGTTDESRITLRACVCVCCCWCA